MPNPDSARALGRDCRPWSCQSYAMQFIDSLKPLHSFCRGSAYGFFADIVRGVSQALMGYSLPGAKIPDLFVFARNCATRGHATPPRPHPPPHPEGRFPHPQTHVGEPHLWVRTHQRAYRALGMGGQNGCPAGNLREMGQIPYHGQY